MTSRPRVYARIRPLNETELVKGDNRPVFYPERGHNDVLVFEKETQNEKIEQQKTRFDKVFDQSSSQEEVFETIGTEILNTLFSGYNATVFAYGQTGSGKSFSMVGSEGRVSVESESGDDKDPSRGLIPRCIESIFARFETSDDITDAKVEMSICQIYQERVQDLFQQRRQLEIHLDRTGQYIAREALWHTVRNPAHALALFYEGSAQRATNATEMNLVSSRSHIIVMLRLQWDEPSLPGSRAQLNLVDLAGSEKLYQSGATGEVMKETIAINKSLSALGNVVSRLVDACRHKDRRVHVPYKDSKLTYLLQSSLGGSNLVHFILALSASALWRAESTSTVEFGKRALQLVLRPVRNPIDYKRLEEMEAMIELMRNRIRNLEEELSTKVKQGDHAGAQQAFLQIKQLQQEGEDTNAQRQRDRARRRSSGAPSSARPSRMRSRAELSRIIANLPETLEDLTSHCILFPHSREDFRNLGGLEKLVHLIDRSPSTFYRAHAAHTVAHVIDDEGRLVFAHAGGIEVVERLLLVKEERCKEAACAALEATVRGCQENKLRVTRQTYEAIVDLTYGYPNQQVQEAACTVLATLVDGNPHCRQFLGPPVEAVRKLLQLIEEAPEEVVHVTKAAATCIGRLAHGDVEMQATIREHNGVEILIDHVLFSSSGDRDHQVPILASYALVNLCCSNALNMKVAQKHPRYDEVRFRLMEGLARAFGNNTVREGFARATASETASPFPYHGITVTDKWSTVTCGGRPIFSSFHENPQFFLYVEQDTNVSLMIQDTLYEVRMQQKMRNATVYMGLAVFQGETELAQAGLKQLDFHGRMVEIAKFTSNCENVLHCTLKKSEAPYIVVPFASQRGRQTNFALSAFGDEPIDLMPIPETTGWYRRVIHGAWTHTTAGGGDTLLWRNNPQVLIAARENTKVVFVLSYLSVDFQRCAADKRDDGSGGNGEEEKANNRPRMHGRLYKNNFAPEKRYSKHFAALPTSSSFVAGNTYSSNSYVTVSANLKAGESYAFVPFTETATQDSFRLCVFTVSDEIDVKPIKPQNEWKVATIPGAWNGEHLRLSVRAAGKMSFVVNSPGVILRATVFAADQQKLFTPESLFSGETWVELDLPSNEGSQPCTIVVEGFVRADKSTPPSAASGQSFQLISYLADQNGLISLLPGEKPLNPTYSVPRPPAIVGTGYRGEAEQEVGSAENPGFYPLAVSDDTDPLDVAALTSLGSGAGFGPNPANSGELGAAGGGAGAEDDEYLDDEDNYSGDGGNAEDGFGNNNYNNNNSNNNNSNGGDPGSFSNRNFEKLGATSMSGNGVGGGAAEISLLRERNGSLQTKVDSLERENSSLKNRLEQAEAQLESYKKAALMHQSAHAQFAAAGGGGGGRGGGGAGILSTVPTSSSSSASSSLMHARPQSSGGSFFANQQQQVPAKTPTLPSSANNNSNNANFVQHHHGFGLHSQAFSTSASGSAAVQQQQQTVLTPGAARLLAANQSGSGNSNTNRREITPLAQQRPPPPPHHQHTVAPPASTPTGTSFTSQQQQQHQIQFGSVRSNSASGRMLIRPSSSSNVGRRY